MHRSLEESIPFQSKKCSKLKKLHNLVSSAEMEGLFQVNLGHVLSTLNEIEGSLPVALRKVGDHGLRRGVTETKCPSYQTTIAFC